MKSKITKFRIHVTLELYQSDIKWGGGGHYFVGGLKDIIACNEPHLK